MKPIRECDQNERMFRALLVLDAMTIGLDDILNSDPKTPVEHFVHSVYRIAHSASGECGNKHLDWLDEIDENTKSLKKAGIMDIKGW